MIRVYHAKEPTFGHGPMPAWPDGYVAVAEVDNDSLEEAFRLTNHIDRRWWENDGVRAVSPRRQPVPALALRSTSVGDVCVDGAGVVWRCENFGWVDISAGLPGKEPA